MSTLQVANIWFESTANNRLQYTGSNSFVLVAGGANAMTINSTAVAYNSSNVAFSNTIAVTGAVSLSNTISVTGNATFSNTIAVTGNAVFSNLVTVAASGVKFSDSSVQTTAFTGFGGQLQSQLFTSSGSWTCPAGVTKAKIWVIGGGGGGAYSTYGCGDLSQGGYGGAALGVYTVSPGTSYTVTVGIGGTGATNNSSYAVTAGSGGSSSFGSLLSATGGAGGSILTNGSATVGQNGYGSNGNIRNGNGGSYAFAPFVYVSNGSITNQTTGITWNVSYSLGPGNPGTYYGTVGSGGINGIVYLEWIG